MLDYVNNFNCPDIIIYKIKDNCTQGLSDDAWAEFLFSIILQISLLFFPQADHDVPDESYLEEEEEAINDTPATTAYMYPKQLQEKRSESNQGQGSSIAHSTGTNLRVWGFSLNLICIFSIQIHYADMIPVNLFLVLCRSTKLPYRRL